MASYLSGFQRYLLEHPTQSDENGKAFQVLDVSHGQIAVMEYGQNVASRQAFRAGTNAPVVPNVSRDVEVDGVSLNSVLNVKYRGEGDDMFGPAKTAYYSALSMEYLPISVEDTAAEIDAKNAANIAFINALKALLV